MTRNAKKIAAAVLMAAVMGTENPSFAAPITWRSNSNNDWLTGGNWLNDSTPGTTAEADFDFNVSNPPSVGINMGRSTNNGPNNEAVGSIVVTANRAAPLILSNSSTTTGGTLTLNGNSGVYLSNASGFLLTIQNYLGSGSQTMSLALAGSGTNNSIGGAANITISSTIIGSSGFTKTGGGTLTLSTGNTYSGKTIITGGVIATSGESAFGASPASFTADQITLNGGTIQVNGGNINFSSNRGLTLGATGGTFDTNGGAITLTNVVTGSGGLTKIASGTLIGAGLHTYTGATTINAGTFRAGIATSGSAGAFGNGSAVTLADTAGATLDLDGFNNTIASLAGGGTSGGNVTLGSANLTLNGSASTSYAGIISGTGGLIKSGSATQTLFGTNTYAGGTAVNAGTLRVAAGSSLGTGPVQVNSLVTAGTTLSLNGNTIGSLSGTITAGTPTIVNNGLTFTINQTAAGIFPGIISGTGGLTLESHSTNTLTLSGANTYAGNTTISAGTLTAGAANTLPSASAVTVNGGALNVSGFAETVRSLTINSAALTLGINYDTPVLLTSTNAIALGGTINVTSTGVQSSGLYTLASGSAVSGSFTQGIVPAGYRLASNVTPNTLDLQHLATIGAINATPNATSIFTGGSTAFTFTVANSAPASSASLAFSAATGTNTAGSVTGPISVTAGTTSSATSGLTFNGTTAGLNQTGGFTVTDPNATNTPQTGSVTVNVYNHALVTASPTSSAAAGSIITFTNSQPLTNPASAKLSSLSITNATVSNGTFGVTNLTPNSTIIAPGTGGAVASTVNFVQTNLLNGATSAATLATTFTSVASDGSAILGSTTTDAGNFTRTLTAVVSGNNAPVGTGSTFGTSQTANVATGATYTLSSNTVAGGSTLGTTAVIRGTAASQLAISEQWRNRTAAETFGNPDHSGFSLYSDAVSITGTSGEYLLELSWSLTLSSSITDKYIASFTGANGSKVGTGSFQTLADATTINLNNTANIGEYGYDQNTQQLFVVTNQNGTFAVVPEPASLGLLTIGAAGLLARRRR